MALKPSAETIVEMLQAAYDLQSFDLPFGDGGNAGMQAAFEKAVAILADRAADRIRRGLYRRHVTAVEDLFFDHEPAGGRRGLSWLFGQDSYLRCSYRSELPGLEDNLILMWTLHAASRARLGNAGLRRNAEDGWRTLAGGLTMTEAHAETGIRRFYARLAVDERPLHGLCRFVIEHTGPQAFRLSMPALFAAYVARWARRALHGAGAICVDYRVRVEPGFRVVVEPAVVIAPNGVDGPRRLVCPIHDGTSLTDLALHRIAMHANALQAHSAILVLGALPAHPPAEREGVVLCSVAFDPGGDLSKTRDACLRVVGCAGGRTPLHRPVGRYATDGTKK